ncbi:hypothetical protein HOK09_01845 [Candidatus Woesearchaeota archaeon]|jgi:hypothetical protein|nr:hypothetical protein [Candidatus Woesearchaeota archaeon]
MANKKTNWQELRAIIIAAAILGFIFGFDDGSSTFILSFWIRNFILQFVMSLIFIMIFVQITKSYSSRKGINSNFSLWNIKRYGFSRSSHYKSGGFPIGAIISLLLSVLSLGKIFFSAILSPEFKTSPSSRLGKKFERATDKELALISLVGPLTLTIMGIVLTNLNSSLSNIAIIPFSIAFCSLIPISALNGARALMGAPSLYIFSVAFVVSSFYLSPLLTITSSILAGVIICLALMTSFYYYIYIK